MTTRRVRISGMVLIPWIVAALGCAGMTVRPKGDALVEAAHKYWTARAKMDWKTGYTYELNKNRETLEQYTKRQSKAFRNLPYELVSVDRPVVDEREGTGTVRVTVLYEFRYPARGKMKYSIKDPWVFKDGRWLHSPEGLSSGTRR